ncbi:MAG: nucleotidyltransferase domain-containing protein [Lachnospiraceae bacterium]|nr:nucleotidyltransferase domain-containing protein [Lachnospiraceae bacterium]
MKNNQQQYIEYVKRFAEENKIHIWLGGSFLNGSSTLFSDVDISVLCNAEDLGDLIYGYGKPVYISYTHNPLGILIIIYENGVAVDLEIIEKIDIEGRGFSIKRILRYAITTETKKYVMSFH